MIHIKRQLLPKKRLFNLLMKSKIMYGEKKKNTKPETLQFLFGTRHNFTIININYIVSSIVRIFKLLSELKHINKKILLIGNSIDIKFMINKQFIKNKSSIIYYTKSWKHGLITNSLNKNHHKELHENLKDDKIKLIIILKSSLHEPVLLNELKHIKVPIIAVTTTSSKLENIQYPILSSSNNLKALYILSYVFRQLL